MQTVYIHDDFNLDKIIESGQCFRAKKIFNNVYRFISNHYILYIKEKNPNTYYISCSIREWEEYWFKYFDLNRNYASIRSMIPENDSFLINAVNQGIGIRILRQDPFETLISFIISQRKSLPAIKKSVELLSSVFGKPVVTPYETIYLFPTPIQIANATEKQLLNCNLGYRSSYVLSAINSINNGTIDLLDLVEKSDEELCMTLKSINGVGDKIANCVSLFSYGRTAIVPIDTWINRIIKYKYFGQNPLKEFGEYAGIIQQYLFYYAIHNKQSIPK